MRLLLFIGVVLSLTGCAPKNADYTSQDLPQKEAVFIENPKEINSLDELAQMYKGKVLYIDIWATWCGPCRMEFSYKNELHDFVHDKDIELIYISIDKPSAARQWKGMVYDFELGGYHIMANKSLKDDLVERFYQETRGDRKILSVPNFVIIDRESKVVVSDARRPSEERKLFKQLSKYL